MAVQAQEGPFGSSGSQRFPTENRSPAQASGAAIRLEYRPKPSRPVGTDTAFARVKSTIVIAEAKARSAIGSILLTKGREKSGKRLWSLGYSRRFSAADEDNALAIGPKDVRTADR